MEKEKNFINKINALPIGIVGATLGLCTLSNAYNLLGFEVIRNCVTPLCAIIFLIYSIKIVTNFNQWKIEYLNDIVVATLYSTISMLIFNFAAFLEQYNHSAGIVLWIFALVLQIISILAIIYFHIYPKRNIEVIYPSLFVPFLGIAVADVVGANMGFRNVQLAILGWAIIVYLMLFGLIIFRLLKINIPENVRHTKMILIAPISLIMISYVSLIENINIYVILCLLMYFIMSLIYVFYNFPSFFKNGFENGYAALTFPMAVSSVALITVSQTLQDNYSILSSILYTYSLIHLVLATIIIIYTYVLLLYNCLIKN